MIFIVKRWDSLRLQVGAAINALENVYHLTCLGYINPHDAHSIAIRETVLRLLRSVIQLLFFLANDRADLSELVNEKLLTDHEEAAVQRAEVEARPMLVMGWLLAMLVPKGFAKEFESIEIHKQILAAKNAINNVTVYLDTPVSFKYTHLVCWTCQILSTILAIETGMHIAIFRNRMKNGDGEYSFDDDSIHFPEDPRAWFADQLVSDVVTNILFCLFTQGLLNICEVRR